MSKNNSYKKQPEFLSNFGLIKFAYQVHKTFLRLDSDHKLSVLYLLKDIRKTLQLRKKLLLNKSLKYENKYYSTPTIPGFPSPAFEYMVSNGGLNYSAAGTDLKRQIDSAFLAITNSCTLNCIHCYEKHNINKNGFIPVENWLIIVKQLQKLGVNIIILTGGEPLLRFNDLIKILSFGDKNLSDFHLHTSGFSITKEKVKALKNAGLTAAAVGLDDFVQVRHETIRGKNTFQTAVEALQLFNEEGILTYVNLCPSKELIRSGGLFEYYDFVKNLNVGLIQLLEPRPCGGFGDLSKEKLLSEEDKAVLFDFTQKGNFSKKYKNHPLIYYVAHIEGATQMGCNMGGLSHFYIDSAGNVNPCVFMPISFGNINSEDFLSIYKRMRNAVPVPIHKECPSVTFSEIIKIKKSQGNKIPIEFCKIEAEWKKYLN